MSAKPISSCNSSFAMTEDDAIKVYVRVRPLATNHEGQQTCINVLSHNSLFINSKPTPRKFTYDYVADQSTTQEDVFKKVGRPIAESCIKGYNGTIFAYGQTGSGKTFTMLGPNEETFGEDQGLIPRTISYLYDLSYNKRHLEGKEFQFLVKCSFIEIYNEQVYDLLDVNKTNPLHVRESITRGVFVDHLIEKVAGNPSEATRILEEGWHNRRVASTAMNRSSSRSHAVFTLTIETKEKDGDLVKVRKSVLNLVDLAGSERQRDTNASGVRLREAGSINKSLSVFGNVIMSLVDASKGKSRHVPYRDSKLTFLLRDSLGGNSRTFIIANVHPSASCFGETLSTLQFAYRAKEILNRATVNENSEGDLLTLQRENSMLKRLLEEHKKQAPHPALHHAGAASGGEVSSDGEGGYDEMFFDAMMLWQMDCSRLSDLQDKMSGLKQACEKRDRMIKSSRMIIKFRDIRIEELEGKREAEDGFDEERRRLRDEIGILKNQVLNHPTVAEHERTIECLKRTLDKVTTTRSVQHFTHFTSTRRAQLADDFRKLKARRDDGGGKEEVRHLADEKLAALEAECSELREREVERKKEVDELKEKLNQAEAQLAGKVAECGELDKLLSASRESARIQQEHLMSIHNSTIRSITTPLRDRRRSRMSMNNSRFNTPLINKSQFLNIGASPLSGMSDLSLVGELGDESFGLSKPPSTTATTTNVVNNNIDAAGDHHVDENVNHDTSVDEQKNKAEEEEEAEMLQIQITSLQQQVDHLKEDNDVIEGKLHDKEDQCNQLLKSNAQLQCNLDNLKKRCDESSEEGEEMKRKLEQEQKRMDEVKQELDIRVIEVRDYRISLESADRVIAEKKKELKQKIEECNKEKEFRVELSKLRPKYEACCEHITRLEGEKSQAESLVETSVAESAYLKHQLAEMTQLNQANKQHVYKLTQQVDTLGDELSEARQLAQGRHESVNSLLQTQQQLRAELSQLGELYETAQQQLAHKTGEIAQLMDEIAQKESTMRELAAKSCKLEAKCDELEAKLSVCGREIEERGEEVWRLQQACEQVKKEKDQVDELLADTKQRCDVQVSNLNFKVDNLEDDLSSFSQEYEVLREAKQQLAGECEGLRARNAKLSEEAKVREGWEEEKRRMEMVVERLTLAQGDWEANCEVEMKRRELQLEQLQTKLQQTVDDYQQARNRVNQLESKMESLKREGESSEEENSRQFQLLHQQLIDSQLRHESELQRERDAARNKIDSIADERREREAELERRLMAAESESGHEVSRLREANHASAVTLERLRDEMRGAEEENRRVCKRLEESQKEVEQLQTKIGDLLGHSNHLQKIKYVKKIKTELIDVTNERNLLMEKNAKLAEKIRNFEELSASTS